MSPDVLLVLVPVHIIVRYVEVRLACETNLLTTKWGFRRIYTVIPVFEQAKPVLIAASIADLHDLESR